mmetsp:Transcript_18770/g.22904  ORF Transcript_18770/g.22904 Transcript_18770/m.22904 type:complete len:193 (-) Transcript_18770:1445-2023(-)
MNLLAKALSRGALGVIVPRTSTCRRPTFLREAFTSSTLTLQSENAGTHLQIREFSGRRSRGKGTKTMFVEKPATNENQNQIPPPPAVRADDAWEPVVDEATKQTYYWNTVTNETTALGAPKPTTATLGHDQQLSPQQYERPGLGQTLKEGFAFGAGAGIARGVVGSMFGGGSGGDDDDYSGGGGSGDGGEWV